VEDPTIRILGPLDVHRDGRTLDLGQRRQRLMLGVLAMWAGEPIPLERLTEIAWYGGAPPPSARNGIHVGMSRLRAALRGTASVSTVGDGYRLDIPRDRVDLFRFRHLVATARERPADARVRMLRDADRLWRGPVLAAELPAESRHRLCSGIDEERIAAIEERVAADLSLGRHRELIAELADLVAAMPRRERLVAELMLALYRDGQAARALDVGAQAKAALAEDLGIDAGPQIRDMELAILRQAPNLDQPQPAIAAAGSPFGGSPYGGSPAAESATADAVVPAQLPSDTAGFIGRRSELRALDGLLGQSREPPSPIPDALTVPNDPVVYEGREPAPAIAVVSGTAGVGKTALVVRWAHAVRERFPDGQLFADLRGYAIGRPTPPVDVLARFVRAFGVPDERVPRDIDGAAAAYRSLLADRRVLIVLDNVADADQVRPLFPGGSGCVVVMTSRQRLDGLVAHDGADHLSLSVLSGDESVALLGRALGTDRIAMERAAADELIALCAYLPLALRIAAATLAGSHRPIGEYVSTLRTGNRLAALAIDGDPRSAVRTAFDLSYADLNEPTQELFRLLGCAPGADVTTPAAAALAGCDAETADRLLRQLVAANLVDEVVPGRFTVHDLLRLYAAEQAEAVGDGTAAVDRLLGWYARTARRAARRAYPHLLTLDAADERADPIEPEFATEAAATRWLTSERPNLLAVVDFAARADRPRTSWVIADALRGSFLNTRDVGEWLVMAETGLAAAVGASDVRAEAAMRLSVAGANHCLARRPVAIQQYHQALALAGQTGWAPAEEVILTNVGNAYADGGDLPAAIESHRLALRQSRRRDREVITLVNLGSALHQTGRLHHAVRHHAAALALARQAEFGIGVAIALQYLGHSEHGLGDLAEARDHLVMALRAHRRTGRRHHEAQTLMDLAALSLDEHRPKDAEAYIDASFTLVRGRSDRQTESYVRSTRGRVRLARGRIPEAIAEFEAAVDVASEVGAPYVATVAEIGLADSTRLSGRFDESLDHARTAQEVADRCGYRALGADAVVALAATRTAMGDTATAVEEAVGALRLIRRYGYRLAEVRALGVLAAAVRYERPSQAERYAREAAAIVAAARNGTRTTRYPIGRVVGEPRIA
jgi:DNA-binding SARP family transcriptional activator/tetratricopeptide (TPR) repeat protein